MEIKGNLIELKEVCEGFFGNEPNQGGIDMDAIPYPTSNHLELYAVDPIIELVLDVEEEQNELDFGSIPDEDLYMIDNEKPLDYGGVADTDLIDAEDATVISGITIINTCTCSNGVYTVCKCMHTK